eukprot:TRINITY_DN15222_c0_g1_i5.p4 TRINITY_DN15222_c0_g1~~TRINITY_DN15222_c0_g1_i5.p4  ORF type:complete len:116 (-),score=23.47 TRINITY_DN15222_c0_g1_i5:999-1346(-)
MDGFPEEMLREDFKPKSSEEIGKIEEDKARPETSSYDECLDRAKGCIVGAFCGDAIGAPLEFSRSAISKETLEKAMRMKLVGTHQLLPGQITDDSELALSMLHGLLEVIIDFYII